MQTREYKVKITIQPGFTSSRIQAWLNDVSHQGWDLITCTFFGQGVIWVFRRDIIPGRPEDPENIDQNAPK